MPDYQGRLDQIERAVDEGESDLRALGFWSLVSEAKRDPGAAGHAEQIGRIDRRAFEARKRPLFPVWLGNLVLLLGILVLLAAAAVALRLASGSLGGEPRSEIAGVVLVGAGLGLSAAVHAPAHWLLGRIVGMRFTRYFLGGPFRIQPGVKVDYGSYLLTPASQRATMHAAGALASKVAPFVVFGWAYVYHWQRGWDLLPPWSLWALLGLGLFQIVTDLLWSTRRSDWKKVRRELRIAREVEGTGEPADAGIG
ncbi:MAG TPA: hypothetical protein VF097_06825 [Actinomycetota bacterium]